MSAFFFRTRNAHYVVEKSMDQQNCRQMNDGGRTHVAVRSRVHRRCATLLPKIAAISPAPHPSLDRPRTCRQSKSPGKIRFRFPRHKRRRPATVQTRRAEQGRESTTAKTDRRTKWSATAATCPRRRLISRSPRLFLRGLQICATLLS